MMSEMMKQCCGADGKPDFAKMKTFMETCGKEGFDEGEIETMKRICGREGAPDFDRMRAFMKKCGCRLPQA